MIDSEDNPVQTEGGVERYDITPEMFRADFLAPMIASIRLAFAAVGVSSVDHLRGTDAPERAPVDPKRIMGAFTEQGEWVQPSPTMRVLKAEPNMVLDVTLTTGEKLRVVLSAVDETESSDIHFVVLDAA